MSSTTVPPVDLSYLQEYTDGDEEVMNELIDVFQETALEGMDDFKKGIHEAEMTIWKAAAHKLKGAAGYVGAHHLKALCSKAEAMPPTPAEDRAIFFQKIELSYKAVHQFLEERKA
ncbi:MAG: Hpt domain-containing protein [Alphaproteobacteria bacterium]